MKNENHSMKRVLSLFIAFVMIMTMLPATIFAADTDTTLYLKPNSNWTQSNAWFAMYYWDGNGDHWAKMTDADGDGYYEAVLPAGFTNVIFCRMNPASSTLSWDTKWDQTIDLSFTNKNCFTVASGAWNDANGTWSTYTPATTPETTAPQGTTAPTQAPATGNSYYLVGWINGADYSGNDYLFVNGKLTTTFSGDTYVAVKDQTGDWYLTESYCTDTTGTFAKGNPEKMFVPGGVQVTFTLTENADGTVTVSYATGSSGSTESAYYLAGYINNADYSGKDYKFTDGKLTATFSADSYVYIIDGSGNWYMTESYCTDTTGTFAKGNPEKMFVPGNSELTFTLTENTDGTLTVSYVTGSAGGGESGGGNEGTGEQCNITLHFADTLGWGQVTLYSWTGSGTTVLGGWPGTSISQDENGFYSHTYQVESGQNVSFIFNNGGSQTVDLSLGTVTSDIEKWVRISGEADGKYTADILDAPFVVVQSPVVKDNTVTFNYEGGSAVQVYGSWDQWAAGKAMSKNSDGIWTLTLQDLQPGTYEYKFVVDGNWVKDPVNGWSQNDNSAFIILDPNAEDTNSITLNIHYSRSDNAYEGWNMYLYNGSGTLTADSEALGEDGLVTTLVLEGRAVQYVNVIPRLSTPDNKWESQEATFYVDLSNVLSGTVDYYITSGSSNGVRVLNSDVVTGHKLSDVQLDYDNNTITVTLAQSVSGAQFDIVNTEDASDDISLTQVTGAGTTYTLTPSKTLKLDTLYQYKIEFEGYTYDIDIDSVYASDNFSAEYTYTGSDLGATWSEGSTTFRVWAPTATDVKVNLYTSGTAGTDDLIKAVPMSRDVNGTWVVTVDGDLNGTYYTYAVNVDGETIEACDPYARTTGVNGDRAMVIDLDSTDPEGWENDTNPNPSTNYTDAVIYELHVRDFSIDDSSGIIEDYQGKFLAFTQEGSTVPGTGISTGIDYLKDLGVTHVHLLPVYDYESVDESRLSDPQFNWGYDPQNYNVPEGSYSTDPYKGEVRVEEFKQMVMALHEAGISVIMDVVYNHVYDAGTFCFNNIVPGYFSRVDSNGSGCGNDTASEREMVHKYIVESVLYWTEEYHIDGFRFDLVGLIDTETINTLVEEVHKIRPDAIFYGEGWTLGTNSEPGYAMSTQQNAAQTPQFAYFSDVIRNLLAGSNGSSTGYVSGATGQESAIVANFKATPWYSSDPEQIVQYASCHDNYTLIDKLIKSTGAIGITDDIISMNNLTAAIYMTSQGIPFIHAGEEMLREKLEEDGGRCENSYNASDYVNAIRWDHLLEEEYADTSEYYKGLIEFRKAHPALRMTSSADIAKYIQAAIPSSNVTAFLIDGSGSGDDDICVIFNANSSPVTVSLPEGIWNVCIDNADSGTETLYTAQTAVQLSGISAMVLTQADTGENDDSTSSESTPSGKSLYFSNNKYWGSVYAYAWDTNGAESLGSWPGSAMTYVQTNDYGEDIYKVDLPASATQIIFHNNSGEQTEDIAVGADGTGYYCNSQTDGKWSCGTYSFGSGGGAISGFTNDGIYEGESQYYLFGWINGENYGCENCSESMGKYQFVDGKVTVEFELDSYVGVKTTDNTAWYMTDGWLGNVTTAKLYNTETLGTNTDKLMIPGGVPVTLTLTENADGSVTLSYEVTAPETVTDGTGVQDGLTLHCWNWSFAEIEANMAKIAEQGYTAIQTSPVQPIKESTISSTVGGSWWVYYQPVDFVIADQDNNALGTKAELESMIQTAHQCGIRVIVDVVANHLANQTGNDLSDQIPEQLTAPSFWHSITTNITDYADRYQCTQQCMGGLPDLNTHNAQLQDMVLQFLTDCIDMGVDGFRFDAAKHIETPEDELPYDSNFWPNVISGAEEYALDNLGKDLYMYGEVLDSQSNIPVSAYTKYMAITDNSWGNTLRETIASGTADMAEGFDKPADASSLVIWAESHDTYATDQAALSSADESEAVINRTWALVAARADAMGLYLARPESNSQLLGIGSVTGWAKEEVKAVNQFHNVFRGQSESIGNEGAISYVERGNSGAVLVNVNGSAGQISVTANAMADGQYTDQLTGNVFTVADGKITGTIGETGIAVVYNPPEEYTITVAETTGGKVSVSQETAAAGTEIVITAAADAGKMIDNITVTAANGESVELSLKRSVLYSFVMPESDVTVTVTFKDATYQVILGGTTDGKISVSNEEPVAGETVTITVKPNSGKKVNKVTVTDVNGETVKVTDLGDGKYSFVQPEGNVTVSVTFQDETGSLSPTGEGDLAFWLFAIMLCSAVMILFLVTKQKKTSK